MTDLQREGMLTAQLLTISKQLASPGKGSVSRASQSLRCQSIRNTRLVQRELGAPPGCSPGGCDVAAVFSGLWLPIEDEWGRVGDRQGS